MTFKFQHPFTCLIAGPTQSGKTHFTFELIKNMNTLIDPVPTKVIWFYGEHQNKLGELPPFVELRKGLEDVDDLDFTERKLLILDDLMREASDAKSVCDLFTKGSHHRNMSIILIIQNLFQQGKVMRTISLNTHYMILFKNPRDAGQIRHLASQLFPGHIQFLVDAYKQATSRAHGYLTLDLTQSTSDNRRVLSDILPGEQGYFYIPK